MTHWGLTFGVKDKLAGVKLTPRHFVFGVMCKKCENFGKNVQIPNNTISMQLFEAWFVEKNVW